MNLVTPGHLSGWGQVNDHSHAERRGHSLGSGGATPQHVLVQGPAGCWEGLDLHSRSLLCQRALQLAFPATAERSRRSHAALALKTGGPGGLRRAGVLRKERGPSPPPPPSPLLPAACTVVMAGFSKGPLGGRREPADGARKSALTLQQKRAGGWGPHE